MKHSPHSLPFGKFKGATVSDIDTDYLRWYASILHREKFDQLYDIIREELWERDRVKRLEIR